MGELIIREAEAGELDVLSDLCMRSKAVWGYDQAFMDACRDELTLTAKDLSDSQIAVAELDGAVAGIAQVFVDGENSELEKLFVDPDIMGKGLGQVLFEWSVEIAEGLGARWLIIDADPDAASFYMRMGAVKIGDMPSGSIEGRSLPRFKYDLTGQS